MEMDWAVKLVFIGGKTLIYALDLRVLARVSGFWLILVASLLSHTYQGECKWTGPLGAQGPGGAIEDKNVQLD